MTIWSFVLQTPAINFIPLWLVDKKRMWFFFIDIFVWNAVQRKMVCWWFTLRMTWNARIFSILKKRQKRKLQLMKLVSLFFIETIRKHYYNSIIDRNVFLGNRKIRFPLHSKTNVFKKLLQIYRAEDYTILIQQVYKI